MTERLCSCLNLIMLEPLREPATLTLVVQYILSGNAASDHGQEKATVTELPRSCSEVCRVAEGTRKTCSSRGGVAVSFGHFSGLFEELRGVSAAQRGACVGFYRLGADICSQHQDHHCRLISAIRIHIANRPEEGRQGRQAKTG